MRGEERRNISARAAVVQRVINGVVQNPSVTLTVDTLQAWLDIPMDAAQRILQRLAASGLVREVQKGVWARGTWPGAQREWSDRTGHADTYADRVRGRGSAAERTFPRKNRHATIIDVRLRARPPRLSAMISGYQSQGV